MCYTVSGLSIAVTEMLKNTLIRTHLSIGITTEAEGFK